MNTPPPSCRSELDVARRLVLIEVGGQPAPCQSACDSRIAVPYLELHCRDLLRRFAQQDHSAHGAELLTIQVERNERQGNADGAAAFDHVPNPTDALLCQSDTDHTYGEDGHRTETNSQPIVSHKFRLPLRLGDMFRNVTWRGW